jgi:hypothetical protein
MKIKSSLVQRVTRTLLRVVTVKLYFVYFCARDTSKAGKKPFSIGVNRIDRGFLHGLAAARGDVKAKKNPLSSLDREPPLLGEDSDVWH